MIKQPRHYRTDLAVIGSGLAGFAASIFALRRDIPSAQVGNTGAVAYTTGYLDLLGCHRQQLLNDPWQGLDLLRQVEPDHPLSRIATANIRQAFEQFTETLTEMGIGYSRPDGKNLLALTPAGTAKPTLSVPNTMLPGVQARATNKRVLVVDFVGLQGFSAKEFVANFRADWPQLSCARMVFPDLENTGQIFPEVMARALEVADQRERFARRLKAILGDAEMVGVPAILGIHNPDQVHTDLQQRVGVPVFEIPTMPPAVPGIRLREMFEQAFPAKGVVLVPQQKVRRLQLESAAVRLYLQDSYGDVEIEASAAIIATGRFLSGGLQADRHRVRETLLGIPVVQPDSRSGWHRADYFDPLGHPINRAGLAVDDSFRPLNRDGAPVSGRLFAAGVLLAHHDWARQRCGAGVAIASAYQAVEAAEKLLRG